MRGLYQYLAERAVESGAQMRLATTVLGPILRDGSVAGGAFSATLATSPAAGCWTTGVLRLTESMIGVRARLFRAYTGDQAIFIRRTVFERAGGYEPIALMEDVRLSAAMRKAVKSALVRSIQIPPAVLVNQRKKE